MISVGLTQAVVVASTAGLIQDSWMPETPSLENCKAAIEALRITGSATYAAKVLNLPRSTFRDRLEHAQREYGLEIPRNIGPEAKGRAVEALTNGTVIVAADFHYWPGRVSTAHRALIQLTALLKPDIIVANGDVCDFCTISRHPPLGWTSMPTAAEEIEAAQDRLQEWAEAGGGAKRYWPVGNHDARMETFIASKAPELKGIRGTSLQEHFPLWEPCYSLWINDEPGGLIVKHRFKGGIHAPWNNAMTAGRSIATGHLHSQKVTPFTNYNGTIWGVDVGCIADPFDDAFQYLEDNPRNWRSGFAVFRFEGGQLLPPDLVSVISPDRIYFRGQVIEV